MGGWCWRRNTRRRRCGRRKGWRVWWRRRSRNGFGWRGGRGRAARHGDRAQSVLLGDSTCRAGAGDSGDIDTGIGKNAASRRHDGRGGLRWRARRGGSRGLLGRGSRAGSGSGRGGAGLEDPNDFAHFGSLSAFFQDSGDDAIGRSWQLNGCLLRFDENNRFILSDGLSFRLQPFPELDFRDGFTDRGNTQFECHIRSRTRFPECSRNRIRWPNGRRLSRVAQVVMAASL